MKILFITSYSPSIRMFRADLIKFLKFKSIDVIVLASDFTPETIADTRALGAVPIKYNSSRSGLNPFKDLISTIELYKIISEHKPDAVFSYFVKPSIYGSIAASFARVPHIVAMLEGLGYIHTPSSKLAMNFKKFFLQRVHGLLCSIGFAFADSILFLNPDDLRDLSRVAFLNKKKLQVLGPIGLDLEAYPYCKSDLTKPIRFIFIARLLAEKGVFEYLAAARLVKQRYTDAQFVVLGGLDFENPAALSKEHLDSVIEDGIIIYPGHVNNVNKWIADSHVFVLPSFREGFPRSTQEAMAIGRAVITTDVPGCRDTVIDGVNGFIVPPRDAEALAEKMFFFIEHPEEIKRMGDESHHMAAARFDVNKINPVLGRIITGEKE